MSFKVKWWGYYIVNTEDWRKPFILKRHFNSREKAEFANTQFKDGKTYEIVSGIEAIKMNIKIYKTIRDRVNNHAARGKQYDYPEWVVSWYDRKRYRIRMQRKSKRANRMEPLTKEQAFFLIERKPVLFKLRCKKYKKFHFPYSSGAENVGWYMRETQDIRKVSRLVATELILKRWYDTGPWRMVDLVPQFYKFYKKVIDKNVSIQNPTDLKRVRDELVAQGFCEGIKFTRGVHNFVSSIHIYPELKHPKECWMDKDDRTYEYWTMKNNIYTFANKVGVPGFTRTNIKKYK